MMLPDSDRSVPKQVDVLFVLPHMDRGGAQRVVSLVASAWARQGRQIGVLTWIEDRDEVHSLDPAVARVRLIDYMGPGERKPWWSWQGLRLRARELERWFRPKLHRHRAKRSVPERGYSGLRLEAYVPASLRGVQKLRYRLARILMAVGRRIGRTGRNRGLASGLRRALSSTAQAIFPRWDAFLSATAAFERDPRVEAFRKAFVELRAPVVVSLLTRTNIYVLEASRGLSCRVIVSERNDPDLQEIDPVWQVLRSISYRRADAVTANSAVVLAKLATFVPNDKLRLLPNPIFLSSAPARAAARAKRFVTVTRLVHQKGVDLLLKAFAEIAEDIPNWSVDVVGDGPLRAQLGSLAEELGVAERVKFRGYLRDPLEAMRAARVFVLPSRFEGMPNSLMEAMACGLAPIVTDSSPGPLECITDGETGLLARSENVGQLAAAMKTLATDDALTERLGRQAVAFVERHDWSVVEAQWLDVLGVPRLDDVPVSRASNTGA
jgi:glycosyltransferase involved in cell wall biosynthesis